MLILISYTFLSIYTDILSCRPTSSLHVYWIVFLIFYQPYGCYMSHPSNHPWIGHPNMRCWRVKFMQFFPSPVTFFFVCREGYLHLNNFMLLTLWGLKWVPTLLCKRLETYVATHYFACLTIHFCLTFWRWIFFFKILAHPVFKMWVIQKPNKVALWNKRHFEERKEMEIIQHV